MFSIGNNRQLPLISKGLLNRTKFVRNKERVHYSLSFKWFPRKHFSILETITQYYLFTLENEKLFCELVAILNHIEKLQQPPLLTSNKSQISTQPTNVWVILMTISTFPITYTPCQTNFSILLFHLQSKIIKVLQQTEFSTWQCGTMELVNWC